MTVNIIRNNMAITTLDNGDRILTSYTTNVAKITKDNRFEKLWNGYSATTMKHINIFREINGFDKLHKKEWLEL